VNDYLKRSKVVFSAMKPTAKELALAILTRIEEREGSANKTKLLKLLYLADIENYRVTGETLTGFDWIFYLYGPWSAEYDSLLEQLEAEGVVSIERWTSKGLEGERVVPKERVSLEILKIPTDAHYRTLNYVDIWADGNVSKLLDYVYFQTEPMHGAEKLQHLDFTKVSKEPPQLYRRRASKTEKRDLNRLRERFNQLRDESNQAGAWKPIQFESGPVDDALLNALSTLENEEA
jgi:hypothetical protein